MKRLAMSVLVVLGVSVSWAEPARLSFKHLQGPLYLVVDEHYDTTNSLVYIGPRSVTVIGATWTPATAGELAIQIRRVTRLPITAVIDTSPDPEWSGGNAYWKVVGARIFAVRATDNLLKSTWGERDQRAHRNHPGYPALPLVMPTDVLPNHFELQHGNLWGFYLGPTHTAGDIFVYFPREQVLDAGSILKPHLGNLADANVRAYRGTLHTLQRMHLKIRTVIAGHWSAVHGPELIEGYLNMLENRARGSQRH
jgi:metallo-beta-lactamase class B